MGNEKSGGLTVTVRYNCLQLRSERHHCQDTTVTTNPGLYGLDDLRCLLERAEPSNRGQVNFLILDVRSHFQRISIIDWEDYSPGIFGLCWRWPELVSSSLFICITEVVSIVTVIGILDAGPAAPDSNVRNDISTGDSNIT